MLTGSLKMQKLVFFNSWKNIILGPGDVSSGLGSVSNYTTLDKSQLYQPWSSHLTVEGMMPGWAARMLYSGAFWQVCAFVPWPTLGEQLPCARLGVGVGTCKASYLEEFMAKELQTWLKSVRVYEPAALGKGWKQIYQFKWWFPNPRKHTNTTRGNDIGITLPIQKQVFVFWFWPKAYARFHGTFCL